MVLTQIFIKEVQKCDDIDIVGTNTRSLIDGQNSQIRNAFIRSRIKYKNIITGYRVDDTSKEKICSFMSMDKQNSQICVAFCFHKAQKDNKQF